MLFYQPLNVIGLNVYGNVWVCNCDHLDLQQQSRCSGKCLEKSSQRKLAKNKTSVSKWGQLITKGKHDGMMEAGRQEKSPTLYSGKIKEI